MSKKKHWREILPSTYLASADLDDGQGGFQTVTVTVTKVYEDKVTGETGRKDDCLLCDLQEFKRPMILNKTNCAAIQNALDTPYPQDWVGQKLILSVDPHAKQFGGGTGPALRFKNYPPKVEVAVIRCDSCQKEIESIKGVPPNIIAQKSKEKYGTALCSTCRDKARAELEKQASSPEKTQPTIEFFQDEEEVL